MITRKDYLASSNHRAYYAQFVTPAVRLVVERRIGLAALVASKDPHMNDIPLAKWDAMAGAIHRACNTKALGEAEGFEPGKHGWSLSTSVCIAKEAARQLKEEAPSAD